MTKADIAIIVVLCIIVAAVVIAMIVAKIKGKGGCSCCDKNCSGCQKNTLLKESNNDGTENNETKAAIKDSKCCAPSKANSACQGCPLSKNKEVCKAK